MRHSDPDGLYGVLGITPDADQNEIKRAYRRLAKQTHPDTSDAMTALEFQKVYTAYKVLSDSRTRARYDRRQMTPATPTRQARPARPVVHRVCCEHCGRVTAQPRQLKFSRVYGLGLITMSRTVGGIFCARCARREAAQSTLQSALFGWWALPFGPFHTLAAIYRNASGGIQDRAKTEELLWQNIQAFRRRGNRRLSYAIARKLQRSSESDLARRAGEVARALELRELNDRGFRLKNPWRARSFGIITHVTMAALVPLALASAGAAFMRIPDLHFGKGVSTISERPVVTILPEPGTESRAASACWKVPRNGEVLYRINPHNELGHRFSLVNNTSNQAIVKIRSAFSKRLIAAVYMSADASAELGGIPDGYYIAQYAFGDRLASGCVSFVNTTGAWQFPDTESLRSIGNGFGPKSVSYSLASAPVDPDVATSLTTDVFNQN